MRHCWIGLLVLTVLVSSTGKAAESPKRPPNLLLIFTDDQSYRTLSCYADQGAWPWVRTPNLDRLAQDGVRFTSAYGAAWCSPSRACVLTGRLPHGIEGIKVQTTPTKEHVVDPRAEHFWPLALRKAGYRTALIGKWHLGTNPFHGRLWDHSVVWDQHHPAGDWYKNQPLSIDGAAPKVVEGYSTDLFTTYASDFIRQQKDQPWSLWLCYNAPHWPNTVHPRHKDQYADAEVSIPGDIFPPRPGKPRYMQKLIQWSKGKSREGSVERLPELVRGYNRLVSALDEGVGKVRQALIDSGHLENTLIIFASDQGFAWGEHGFRHKIGPYDPNLKMPFIVCLPDRGTKNAVCHEPVTVVDIAPTLLDFAGVKPAWEMHGRSLRPLLEEPQKKVNRIAVMENTSWQFGAATDGGITRPDFPDFKNQVPWWIFLRQGRFKYIRTLVDDEIEELYDLQSDPDEMTNLACDPSKRDLLEKHRTQLFAEMERTKAGWTRNLPTPKTCAK